MLSDPSSKARLGSMTLLLMTFSFIAGAAVSLHWKMEYVTNPAFVEFEASGAGKYVVIVDHNETKIFRDNALIEDRKEASK